MQLPTLDTDWLTLREMGMRLNAKHPKAKLRYDRLWRIVAGGLVPSVTIGRELRVPPDVEAFERALGLTAEAHAVAA